MKIVKRQEANQHKNSKNCIAYEYPLENLDINIATVDISGRYPDEGQVVNEVCTEIVYLLKGKRTVTFDNGEQVELESGDVVLLDKGDRYYWEGECSLCIPCTPAWYPEQHKIV